MNDITITDVLQADYLQKVQDAFAAETRTDAVIVDRDGFPVTKPSNYNGGCRLFHGADVGSEACHASTKDILEQNRTTGEPVVLTCPYSGLTTIALPVFLKDLYLGSWIIGQIRIVDQADLRDQTEQGDRSGQAGKTEQAEQNGRTRETRTKDQTGQIQTPSRKTKRQASPKKQICKQTAAIAPLDPAGPKPVVRGDFARMFHFLQMMNGALAQQGLSNFDALRTGRMLRDADRRLNSTNEMLRRFINCGDVAMYVCDFHTGEILMANAAYCGQAGLPMQSILGEPCWVMNGTSSDSFCEWCPRSLLLDGEGRPGKPYSFEYFNGKFGLWLRCTMQPLMWMDERLAYMVT